ncbi:MAG TPA: TetR family transcriptional regulator [Trebonia sp.]|jgi:AcrR family transcriptional regulator|nr:TetR family transcriptional regulator [Trebonia sp.]
MARWEPNTAERLVRAALDLFTEQGYDATTVSEIAARAGGLSKMTFFRYFADKREVLFAGQEAHRQLVTDAIAAAPAPATPLEAVAAALGALGGSFTEDRRDIGARLLPVIAANGELRERAVAKRAALSEAMTAALEQRGVPGLPASLAAELGTHAFYRAFAQWAGAAGGPPLTELTQRAFGEVRAAAASLG